MTMTIHQAIHLLFQAIVIHGMDLDHQAITTNINIQAHQAIHQAITTNINIQALQHLEHSLALEHHTELHLHGFGIWNFA